MTWRPWAWLLASHHPLARRARLVGVAVILGFSAFWGLLIWRYSRPDALYAKDILQEYLAGRALRAGLSPYLPLPELMARFYPGVQQPMLPHPTPHPPPALLLTFPLAFLSFPQAVGVWLGVELVFLLAWVALMGRQLTGQALTVKQTLLWGAMLLSLAPVAQDLVYGQWMIILLFLLSLAFWAGQAGRPGRSGFWLGLTLGLKPIFWPFLLALAVRRAWKTVLMAGLTAALWWGMSALFLGPQEVLRYLLHTQGTVAPYYQGFAFNFSLWTLAPRMFSGTGSPALVSLVAPPLWEAPALVPWVTGSLIVLTLALALGYTWKARLEGARLYSLWLPLSVVLSPVAWRHYFVILFLPVALTAWGLRQRGWPGKATTLWLVTVLLLGMPDMLLEEGLKALAGGWELSAGLAQLTWLPVAVMLAGVIGLGAGMGDVEVGKDSAFQ